MTSSPASSQYCGGCKQPTQKMEWGLSMMRSINKLFVLELFVIEYKKKMKQIRGHVQYSIISA
jgi:hypothetical protein